MRKIFCVKKKTLLLISGIFPDTFVAFFYSGLGCALAMAGVIFAKNYLCYNRLAEELN